jgi:hypothetical protein
MYLIREAESSFFLSTQTYLGYIQYFACKNKMYSVPRKGLWAIKIILPSERAYTALGPFETWEAAQAALLLAV